MHLFELINRFAVRIATKLIKNINLLTRIYFTIALVELCVVLLSDV